MPAHLTAIDGDRHPCKGASSALAGQVIKALGSDGQQWVSISGDVSGPPDATTVTDLTIASEARGDILYRGAASWQRLAAGSAGDVLTHAGPGADPFWSPGAGGTSGTTNVSWSVNTDASAALLETPYFELLGGDGVAAPNDDLVRARWVLDTVNEVTQWTLDRNRHSGGFSRITPVVAIGVRNNTANFGSELRFDGGDGTTAQTGSFRQGFSTGSPNLAKIEVITADFGVPGTGGGSQKVGIRALAAGSNDAVFGDGAATGTGSNNTAIGSAAQITAGSTTNSVAVGRQCSISTTGISCVGVGAGVNITGTGNYGVAIGQAASCSVAAAVAVGRGTQATIANGFFSGSPSAPITMVLFGSGDTDSPINNLTFRMTNGVGTNVAAGNWTFEASRSTGSGATGYILFRAAPAGGSGSGLNALADRFKLDGVGVSWFGSATAAQQTSGANLANNVTSGGTNDQIDNWTDLTTYATDAAAIRNAVYQLARKLKQINDGLRTFGLFT